MKLSLIGHIAPSGVVRRVGRRAVFTLLLSYLAVNALTGCHGGKGVRWAESSAAPAVRVNQLGYLPRGAKWATIRSEQPTPLEVELRQGDSSVWRGKSQVRGRDEASGDHVHWVDFSSVSASGKDFQLHVPEGKSFAFAIEKDVYQQLKFDALRYFYHNRSGVPITEPFVPRTYTRPAGHVSDSSVPCWLKEQCSYRLNVQGGWYDAGDHGKYVVNGGISAWTLLALYERMTHLSKTADQWGDGTLQLPESGNGAPDLLDEARFEVEFLLRMQVPAGQPLAGMVHHKIHDNAWTPLGIEPPTQSEERALHPPSTAATLNMSAVAAQAARIFRSIDPAFASYCLQAAETAYQAALEHPDRFAPELDKQGGGPYSDNFVDDEFFWAAAELYVSTGKEEYKQALEQNAHYANFPTVLTNPDGGSDGDGVSASFSWQSTAGLGWISLAVVPNSLPQEQLARLRSGIVQAADVYEQAVQSEGYRLPLLLGESKKYPWGSNSFVLNNMLVLSLAYDLTKEAKYADATIAGMDYILGRNPMVQSYVTGYGTAPLEHPHHRFWAHSLDPSFPSAPPGAVSGGPNSSLQDPQTKKSGLSSELPPQKCFVDHIDAWSVNEVTINWNAPLAWSAIFLDEYAKGAI